MKNLEVRLKLLESAPLRPPIDQEAIRFALFEDFRHSARLRERVKGFIEMHAFENECVTTPRGMPTTLEDAWAALEDMCRDWRVRHDFANLITLAEEWDEDPFSPVPA
jgi:hypothetical protein